MFESRVRRTVVALAATATVSVVSIISLRASSPRFFQAATQSDFLKGEVENLSIDSRGQLMLGPATDLVYETAASFLWSLVAQPDGSLVVGSGNQGQVYRIDERGAGARLFEATELEVHALAAAPNGGVYAATSPDGKIYQVDRNGTAKTFFDPEEKYIWALTTDSKGNVYAATGQKGAVYKIAPDGNGAVFYQSKSTHVTALTLDKAGNLFVGTESPGRVFRLDADGTAFLLLDSPLQEIRAFRFDDKGALYVAAVSGRPSSGAAPTAPPPSTDSGTALSGDAGRAPVPVVTTEVTSAAIVDTSGGSGGAASASQDRGTVKGAVYRIAPDGLWDEVWESRDDSPYDLIFDSQGRLVIGTGGKGKIYRLDGDPPQPTLLAHAAAEQVTAFYKDQKGQLYYTTANPGKLFRLSADLAAQGAYVSEPRDAQIGASWGSISWRGTATSGIEVFTRSGNTATPDEAWSPWSTAYKTPEGSAITSPKARFLQWRVTLSGRGQSPVLTSVTAAYLQRNMRPEVRSITVHPPGIVYQKPFGTGDPDLAGFDNQTTPDRRLTNAAMAGGQGASPPLGRRTYEKGLQTLAWRAEDQNNDDLSYEVQYRREGETNWKVLRSGVTDAILVWDTTTVPNGTYFARLVASDAPSNAAELALNGELVSSAFEVDNTPPEIIRSSARVDDPGDQRDQRGQRTVVTFDVRDDHSPIQRVECSEDGQQWRAIFPADGIADSKQEHYEVTIDRTLGPRGLSLRATDSMNNVATSQVDAPPRR